MSEECSVTIHKITRLHERANHLGDEQFAHGFPAESHFFVVYIILIFFLDSEFFHLPFIEIFLSR